MREMNLGLMVIPLVTPMITVIAVCTEAIQEYNSSYTVSSTVMCCVFTWSVSRCGTNVTQWHLRTV